MFKYSVLFMPLPFGSCGAYFTRHSCSFHVLCTDAEFDRDKQERT